MSFMNKILHVLGEAEFSLLKCQFCLSLSSTLNTSLLPSKRFKHVKFQPLYPGIMKTTFWSLRVLCSWVKAVSDSYGAKMLIRVINRVVFTASICILSLGGAMVGTTFGAIKGQTTEIGFLKGAITGSVAGAIAAIQLLDSAMDGEPFSKAALFGSLVNGKVFMEWVSPAVLKAYQWQINTLETTYREVSDIYDVVATKGLSQDCILKLPSITYHSYMLLPPNDLCCSICIQEMKEGESIRRLPKCGHSFHIECIDIWLMRQNSCPVCRMHVCEETNVPQIVIS